MGRSRRLRIALILGLKAWMLGGHCSLRRYYIIIIYYDLQDLHLKLTDRGSRNTYYLKVSQDLVSPPRYFLCGPV